MDWVGWKNIYCLQWAIKTTPINLLFIMSCWKLYFNWKLINILYKIHPFSYCRTASNAFDVIRMTITDSHCGGVQTLWRDSPLWRGSTMIIYIPFLYHVNITWLLYIGLKICKIIACQSTSINFNFAYHLTYTRYM